MSKSLEIVHIQQVEFLRLDIKVCVKDKVRISETQLLTQITADQILVNGYHGDLQFAVEAETVFPCVGDKAHYRLLENILEIVVAEAPALEHKPEHRRPQPLIKPSDDGVVTLADKIYVVEVAHIIFDF